MHPSANRLKVNMAYLQYIAQVLIVNALRCGFAGLMPPHRQLPFPPAAQHHIAVEHQVQQLVGGEIGPPLPRSAHQDHLTPFPDDAATVDRIPSIRARSTVFRTRSGRARALPTSVWRPRTTFWRSVPVLMREQRVATSTQPGREEIRDLVKALAADTRGLDRQPRRARPGAVYEMGSRCRPASATRRPPPAAGEQRG